MYVHLTDTDECALGQDNDCDQVCINTEGATSAAVLSGIGCPGSHAAKVSEEGEGN